MLLSFAPKAESFGVSAQMRSGVVRGGPEGRFHQGSTRVPRGFHEGSTGFHEVLRGLRGGASTKKSTACWGYHLSLNENKNRWTSKRGLTILGLRNPAQKVEEGTHCVCVVDTEDSRRFQLGPPKATNRPELSKTQHHFTSARSPRPNATFGCPLWDP